MTDKRKPRIRTILVQSPEEVAAALMHKLPPGSKLDDGKEPMRLVLQSMPRALLAVGDVAAYGATKYSEDGWQHVPRGVERYTDAMFRHALCEGIEDRDAESGLMHAAQTPCAGSSARG